MNNYERQSKNRELLERIYDNVRVLMEAKGITSTELEKAIGVGYGTFYQFKYEKDIQFSSINVNGEPDLSAYDMRITFLAEIAKYFDIPLEYLIGRDPEALKKLMTKREVSALENKLKALKAQ